MTKNQSIHSSNAPFFSVIITTYNRADLLLRALDSLIRQIEQDWEAVIIDDGSTDDTKNRILPFLNKKIHYVWQPPEGASAAKNSGILFSKGKYITFLDSDDEYDEHHLQLRKMALEENEQIEFMYGGIKIIGNPFVPNRFDFSKMIHLSHCSVGGTFFIKKRVFLSLGGFAEIPFGSDADFFQRINSSGIHITKCEHPTYIYHRDNENTITNNIAASQCFSSIAD